MTRRISLLLLAMTMLVGAVSAQSSTGARKAEIVQLLEMTQPIFIQQVSDLSVKDVTESLKAADPNLSPQAIAAATQETLSVVREHAKDFSERMYPVYDKLFSQQEIEELLRFYKTPLGMKLIQVTPALTAEAVQAGKEMGKTLYPTITQRVLARLKKEGFWR